jgi:hypothetical protein
MTNLTPAAQAAWTAYETADCDPYLVDPRKAGLAAAIRAAADQLGYSNVPKEFAYMRPKVIDVDDLLAIADELEATA